VWLGITDLKALIIAPWGYPPQWRRVSYSVRVTYKGFDAIEIDKCITCSSTLALVSAISKLTSRFNEVKVLVLGLDTAVQPKDHEDGTKFRERVKRIYEEWLMNLLNDCRTHGCCKGISEKLFIIDVLPGIGMFNGWRYLAKIDDLFVKAFLRVRDELKRLGNRTWIFIDITHGINYQTISVMYASLAAVISELGIKGLTKTFILNSEPAMGGELCIKVSKNDITPQAVSELNILDVTRLHTILNFIYAIISLSRLEYLGIEEGIKELRKYQEDEAQRLAERLSRNVLPAIKALRLGAVVPVFNGSKYYLDNYDLRICLSSNAKYEVNRELVPKIDHTGMTVSYDSTSAWYLLENVLNNVITKLCSCNEKEGYCLNSDNLLGFLDGISKLYNDLKLYNLSQITNRTKEELKAITGIWYGSPKDVVLPIEVYYILWHLRKSEVSLNKIKELVRDVEKLQGSPDARNFIAHSGLDFRTVKSLRISKKGIIEVIYDSETLKKVLRELNII